MKKNERIIPPSAVVDASVLVSAFLFPRSTPDAVLPLAGRGGYTLCFSPILIEETRRSLLNPRLRKPYGHSESDVDQWIKELLQPAVMVTELPVVDPICRDPDDDHVIAAAIAAKAEYIVTGDKDLLSLGTTNGIRMVTANEFIEQIFDA